MTERTSTPIRRDAWLTRAADLAMSALLARVDIEQAGRPFFWVDFRGTPQPSHSYWDYNDIAGRYVDGLVLARTMTGREDGREAEALLRRFLWDQQAPADGLFYNPEVEAGSGADMDKYRPEGRGADVPQHVDLFCQRAPLLALSTLLAAGDEFARPRLEAFVRGLAGIAVREGDEAHFPTYRWAPTLKPEWYATSAAPMCNIGYRYALLTGLARYVELSADPFAAEFALALARYYRRHGDVPPDGRFRGNTHSGGILPTLVGIARLAAWSGDREMLAWVDSAYRWARAGTPDFGFIVDGFGLEGFFSGTCETCSLADLLHLAIVLTEAGAGDYWDDVERYARNQLVENQFSDPEALRQALPGLTDRVLSMLLGGYECAAYPNSLLTWDGAEGCCIGGGLRALYMVWRAAVAETEDETRVNLGLSRATPYADVVGHEPWAGLLEVRVHTPRRVLIRLPEGLSPAQVRTLVDGQPVAASWQGRYAVFTGLQVGQIAALAYPLPERTSAYDIAGKHYEGDWRGRTLIEIRPAGGRYPVYRRRPLLALADPAADALSTPRQSPGLPAPALW